MLVSRRCVSPRHWAISVIAIGACMTLSSGGAVKAQGDVPPYPAIMTLERAQAFVRAAERKLEYLPGEVIVKFKAGVTVAGQQRALDAIRSRPLVGELRRVGEILLLRDRSEPDATILAAQLSAQPEVEYAQPNYLGHVGRTPSDPGFSTRQWNFSAIDLPKAWDINDGADANITVAVIDTGVTNINRRFTFPTWNGFFIQDVVVPFAVSPDLSASRLVSPRDFVFGGGDTVMDMDGHGTHVASTIAEDTNNALAEAGIAYRANIMPIKVCVSYWEVQFSLSANGIDGFAPLDVGGCPNAEQAQGIRYAVDNGAKVISISLWGTEPSPAIEDALEYAVERGAFVAVLMGNSFEDGNPVLYPAKYAEGMAGVMSVAAIGRSLRRSYYSSTGAHAEIAAPGGDVRDGGLNGEIWQTTLFGPDFDARDPTVIFPRFDRYAETPKQGTSMATPHVSGIAALIMSQGVGDPAAVEALIKKTARFLGTPNPSTPGRNREYGYGLIQPRLALRGFGIVK